METNTQVPCGDCGGSGIKSLPAAEHEYTCRTCHGHGTVELTCSACGEPIDDDCGESMLGDEWDGEPLCEGCAEDTIDAIRSGDADARELGLDYIEEHGE